MWGAPLSVAAMMEDLAASAVACPYTLCLVINERGEDEKGNYSLQSHETYKGSLLDSCTAVTSSPQPRHRRHTVAVYSAASPESRSTQNQCILRGALQGT